MKKFATILGVLVMVAVCWAVISLSSAEAALKITPETAVIETGGQVKLSVTGATGKVRWSAGFDGKIEGTGTEVAYIAPSYECTDTVTALDEGRNTSTATIVVQKKQANSFENATWEVFTYRGNIRTLALSEDGKTLWVGTGGGLEQRDAATGNLIRVHTKKDGLPSYSIKSVITDGNGSIWVGTTDSGLAHRTSDGKWEVLNTKNSGLPDNSIYALLSDGNGGIWIGTQDGGLAHRTSDGKWEHFYNWNSELPYNSITALLSDGNNGIWIGTKSDWNESLAHRTSDGKWEVFNKDNSGLPDNWINALLSDGNGGIWIGTGYGLAHRTSDGKWEVLNTKNSGLPDNSIYALLSDGNGGIWVGTVRDDLAHRTSDGKWEVLNTKNSGLPENSIACLLSDGNGGIWVGTFESGLARRTSDGKWEVFNKDISGLPENSIACLLSDGNGGIWVGTFESGLAHRTSEGKWEVFNKDNSGFPQNEIRDLSSDDSGGIWVGFGGYTVAHQTSDGKWEVFERNYLQVTYTRDPLSDGSGGSWFGSYDEGLVHQTSDGRREVFNTDNSDLPNNIIIAFLSDGSGGLWLGTYNGLVHLTFGSKEELCKKDPKQCKNLYGKNRAAIIIAGGGNQPTNTLWNDTQAITTRIYEVFSRRGFDKSEIYYLSPQTWADFNGDGQNDYITHISDEEGYLKTDDVRKAFEWAKKRGRLDYPLYVFFVDHGGTDGALGLGKSGKLGSSELKSFLDEYQNDENKNQVAVFIDACYSGLFLKSLAGPGRAVITSTKADQTGIIRKKESFSYVFADYLAKGGDMESAFRQASKAQKNISAEQIPQLDDNGNGIGNESGDGQWLRQIYVNGDFVTADATLEIESLSFSAVLKAGEPLTLKAKATTLSGKVDQVWAVIRPPKIDTVYDSNGTPIGAYPRLYFSRSKENVSQTESEWEGVWRDSVYNGEYKIIFYAQDNTRNIAWSETLTVTVSGGAEPPQKAAVQVNMAKNVYHANDSLKVDVVENLGWGYDLYAVLIMPGGQIFMLTNKNEGSPIGNTVKKWLPQSWQLRPQNSAMTVLDMTLPKGIPAGQYCIGAILSPESQPVLDEKISQQWVWDKKCFDFE